VSKKRRKPRSGKRPAPRPQAVIEDTVAPPRPSVPGFFNWLTPRTSETVFPSVSRSIGRGILVVGSSALILGGTFVFVFLAWVGLVALGFEGPPGRIVDLAALPPISTYFDALNGVAIFGYGLAGTLASLGFLLLRALVVAVLTGLIVVRLEGEGTTLEGVLRGLRAYPTMLTVNVIAMVSMLVGSFVLPILGAGIGFLGYVLLLVAVLFLLAFAPAAAVREERPVMETLRRSGRAAMMPRSRHALMCLLYIFLALPLFLAFAPQGNLLTVNPSIRAWVYGLCTSFVHVAFLAAFSYRWMAVEDEVPEQPVKRAGGAAARR
jgi:hypothetical protein